MIILRLRLQDVFQQFFVVLVDLLELEHLLKVLDAVDKEKEQILRLLTSTAKKQNKQTSHRNFALSAAQHNAMTLD